MSLESNLNLTYFEFRIKFVNNIMENHRIYNHDCNCKMAFELLLATLTFIYIILLFVKLTYTLSSLCVIRTFISLVYFVSLK